MSLQIESIHIENLRGYDNAKLELRSRINIIVGKNNSGKTSLLKLLDFFINDISTADLWDSKRLSDDELKFLIPARDTRKRARRATLLVNIADGRKHKKFKCDGGIAQLRFNIRLTPNPILYIKVGNPQNGEQSESDIDAIELLTLIKEQIEFVHIPSFRDVESNKFRVTFLDILESRLSERVLPTGQGGTSSEYRKVIATIKNLQTLTHKLANPLWNDIKQHLPKGMLTDGQLVLNVSPEEFVNWISGKLEMNMSTGEHDSKRVPIAEVGSGLQSLMDWAIQRSEYDQTAKSVYLAFEEPESFLHPSAQRTVSRVLFDNDKASKIIITTHSPIIIEESKYGDVILCRDQQFYHPALRTDLTRDEINTALLSGHGAEMLFAGSVLLVEGEGDRQYFERIRRRMSKFDDSGRMDELYVVPVGGKQQFAPWINLITSYGLPNRRPIHWLIAADCDACEQLKEALRYAGISIPKELFEIMSVLSSQQNNMIEQRIETIARINQLANDSNVRVVIVPIDLEYAILAKTNSGFLNLLAQKAHLSSVTKTGIMQKLGSKAYSCSDPIKSPWIRGFIGEQIPAAQIDDPIIEIMKRWMEPIIGTDSNGIISAFKTH